MSAGQHIDYDALVRGAIQEAKRSVVRSVLQQVAKSGLVGGHHFLIAFNTLAPGVSLSKRLKDKYPLEMTIVLQHRFWDLEVSDDRFEVKLTFDSIPERLAIPFTAIKAFYDPSVPYMMPFDDGEPAAGDVITGAAAHDIVSGAGSDPDAVRQRRRDRMQRRTRVSEREAEPTGPGGVMSLQSVPSVAKAAESKSPQSPVPAQPATRPKPAAIPEAKPAEGAAATKADDSDTGLKTDGAKVLDLSAFRKKK